MVESVNRLSSACHAIVETLWLLQPDDEDVLPLFDGDVDVGIFLLSGVGIGKWASGWCGRVLLAMALTLTALTHRSRALGGCGWLLTGRLFVVAN